MPIWPSWREVVCGALPYMGLMLLALVLLMPDLVLWLPGTMYG